MKKFIVFLSALLLLHTAYAYRIEWGRTIVITQPVHEDLYIAGGTITLNAPVYGDMIVAGGTITINDSVTNDLLIAGGTVIINAFIGDDVRCAGGNLRVSKNIGGDLVITGGNVVIDKNVWIAGGLVSGGGETVVNGTVSGNIKAGAGKFTFNGIANRNFESKSQDLLMNGVVLGRARIGARNISIGNNAVFYNDVRYWNRAKKLDFGQSIINGKAVYDPALKVETSNWYYLGRATILGMIWYLSVVFLFIVLIEYLFGKTFNKAGVSVESSVWRSLGMGFLFFIGIPFLVLLLAITIIGIPFGVLLMLSYIGLIILATTITALVIANWYNNHFKQHWTFWKVVLSAFFLFIVLKIITFTPVLGWLVMFVFACVAFGSILRNITWPGRSKVAVS